MRLLLLALALVLAAVAADKLTIPAGLDAYMPVPAANPLTVEKVALGRRLFFDRRLSRDSTIACSSCHDPAFAFSDGRTVATGVGGQKGPRRSPRIANRAWGKSFFWDGRAASLEEQVLQPIANPREMDSSPAEAARRVGVAESELRDALAAYVRTILSGDAPFDRYMAGDQQALAPAELLGLRIFTGKGGCASCHVGPNFTDERFHNTGAGSGADPGRVSISHLESDTCAFKTPSLRDCARTPPYMHDGSLATLEEVVDFYDKGGRANLYLDPDVRPLHLTAGEKSALAAFLRALNGKVRDGF